jgi:hypothetical protein
MKYLFVVFVAIALMGCAHHEVTQRDVAPNKTPLAKSETQREITEREAYAGDNAAARRLADYYFAKNDRATGAWWLKLAASRGDAVAKEKLKAVQQE